MIALMVVVFISFILPALAHPGRTDGRGGHTNHSTGEYHYHHGYPAHDHVDGVCPYNFDDKTGERSGTSSAKGGTSTITTADQTLQNGDRGADVKLLQERLNSLGYSVGAVDGIFGPKTENAVKEYQRDHLMLPTGKANKRVLLSLFPEQKPASATSQPTPRVTLRPTPRVTVSPPKQQTADPTQTYKKWTEKERILAFQRVCGIIVLSVVIACLIKIRKRESAGDAHRKVVCAPTATNNTLRAKLEQLKQQREMNRIIEARRIVIGKRQELAMQPGYKFDYTQGVAYVNILGEDQSYHNNYCCCNGSDERKRLVTVRAAKEIGLVQCQLCKYDIEPSVHAYVAITPRSISLYHSVRCKCITSHDREAITLTDAKARGLKPCTKCFAPVKDPRVWF